MRLLLSLLLVSLVSGCQWMKPGAGGSPVAVSATPAVIDGQKPKIDRDVDPKLATTEPESELDWFDAKEFLVEGKGWPDTNGPWERLPARAEWTVTPAVWNLSKQTAGISVRFITDSRILGAAWDGGEAMNHMAATGVSGLDLYRRTASGWEFAAVGRPKPERTVATLLKDQERTPVEYLLFLPLYQKVTDLKIGVEKSAILGAPAKRTTKPIVFYGTSITQGGCASRTGMCHTALLSRWLDREVINLGFSGAGKMEPAMADLLGEIDTDLYVLDAVPNMTPELVEERAADFVRRLRNYKPETPILLVENPSEWRKNTSNIKLREAFAMLQKEGVKNITLMSADVLEPGPEEATVDGVHPTDLGFYRYALAFEPRVKALLPKK